MRLVVIEVPGLPPGATQRHEFDLQPDPAHPIRIIGRQLGCDIHLIDPSVSRSHAEVTLHPEGLIVRDLGSANGTYINERPLQSLTPTMLRPGERLRVGNVVTLLEAWPVSNSYKATEAAYSPQSNYPYNDFETPRLNQSQSPRAQMPPGESQTPAPPPSQPRPRSAPAPVTPAPGYNPAATPNYPSMPAPPGSNYSSPAPSGLDYPPVASATPAYRPAPPNPNQLEVASRYGYDPRAGYSQPGMVEPLIPAIAPVGRQSAGKRRKSSRGILALTILLVLAILGGVGYLLYITVINPSPTGLPAVKLPSNVFTSPANNDAALGLTISRPSAWKRNDATPSQILFYQPENPKTVLNIEQSPSPTIVDAKLTPEAAIRQYLANVRANATTTRIVTEPSATQLKDGTAAVLARLVFSTDGTKAAAVTDYNMIAISFKCGDKLYFVSAAAEGKDYNAATRQDLDAAIANVMCSVQ